MSWADTVRPWKGPGVELVTTTSPDMIGIRFPDSAPASAEERNEMVDVGLRFRRPVKAYLTNLPPVSRPEDRRRIWDEIEALHQRIHERRAAASGSG